MPASCQYASLHLAGYDLTLDDLKQFRQWGSRTPGHPDGATHAGVETTTGPLGQGFANGVGMAIAAALPRRRATTAGHEIVDHADLRDLLSDGDLMEGVRTRPPRSPATCNWRSCLHLRRQPHHDRRPHRDRFYRRHGVALQGLGWHVVKVADANDLAPCEPPAESFQDTTDRPTLIIVRSHIACGLRTRSTRTQAHGAPLGEAEIKATKAVYGWPEDAKFLVPDEVTQTLRRRHRRRVGRSSAVPGAGNSPNMPRNDPELAAQWLLMELRELPAGWDRRPASLSRRSEGYGQPHFVGQGAKRRGQERALVDRRLGRPGASTMTNLTFDGAGDFEPGSYGGRNFHFGIREHGMAARAQRHGSFRRASLRLDVLRVHRLPAPSMRLAALMQLPRLYLHPRLPGSRRGRPDASADRASGALRAISNLLTIRPADANETSMAWRIAVERPDGPVALP